MFWPPLACRQSFASTRLSATRMLHFVEERQKCVRRLVLMNSEGYWSGETAPAHVLTWHSGLPPLTWHAVPAQIMYKPSFSPHK